MSEEKFLNKFGDFGKSMFVIAIMTVLGLIPSIQFATSIISFIFMIIAIGHVKKINENLSDTHLKEFRSRYLLSYILTTIATIGLFVVIIILVITLYVLGYITPDWNVPTDYTYEQLYALLDLVFFFLGFVAFFVIILFIGAVFEMKAWRELNEFFTNYRNKFPTPIINDAIDGTRNLKNATLCNLLFFLIITPIIGIVLKIIGYFKLSRLKDLTLVKVQPAGVQQEYPRETAPITQSAPMNQRGAEYCPFCGSEIKAGAKFCSKCGSEI